MRIRDSTRCCEARSALWRFITAGFPATVRHAGRREGPVSRDKSEDLPERVLMKELSGRKVMFERLSDYIIPSFVRLKRHSVAALALLCLSGYHAEAQDMFSDDTININAVTVTAAASRRQSPFTVAEIDSATITFFEGEDLATLVNSAGSLTVRRYGNTGLASVLVRGMSGSHTLIIWNGLPVSSPNNGSGDFAIIPVMQRSSVRLTAGGSDLGSLSGSIGGKIELSADPDFSRDTEATLSLGAGSYNDYSTALTVQSGSDRISAGITMWGVKGRNDFIFINPNSPDGETRERRTNSSYSGSGAITDLSLRLRQSTFSAHVWYSDYDRELPGPVTTVQQDFGEKQVDRSLRGVLNYSFSPGRFTAEVTAGESYDINLYNNETYATEGDNRSGIYLLRTRLSYRPGDRFEFTLNAGDEYQWAKSLSFEETESRNIVSISLIARYSPVPRIRLLLQARQMAVTGTGVKPEITAAASFLVSGDGKHILKLNVSRNSQLPCLNDLYWMPGGNASLMPETSTGGEAGYSYAGRNDKGWRNTFDITVHRSGVENLIQWIPGDAGLWSARNVRSVLITGVESRLGTEVPLKNGALASYLNYTLTSSVIAGSDILNDRSVGSQLIYTPLNHIDINVIGRWKFIRAGLTGLFESRRYITSDNSEWLPAVFIADASIGAVFNVFRTVTSLNFRINNLAGTPYESVSNYPMPLRTCTVRLNVAFTNKR